MAFSISPLFESHPTFSGSRPKNCRELRTKNVGQKRTEKGKRVAKYDGSRYIPSYPFGVLCIQERAESREKP